MPKNSHYEGIIPRPISKLSSSGILHDFTQSHNQMSGFPCLDNGIIDFLKISMNFIH